jgi:TIR domain-containing protein
MYRFVSDRRTKVVVKDPPAAFVRYSREDSDFALKLARDLLTAGVRVWLDQLNLIPGQEWDREIEAAVMNCPRMLVILTPTSVISKEVANEFNSALDEDKIVIPVFHRDCSVPFRLRRRQRADFRQAYAPGLQELLRALASSEDARPSAPTKVDIWSDDGSNRPGEVMRQAAEGKRHDGGHWRRSSRQLGECPNSVPTTKSRTNKRVATGKNPPFQLSRA